MAYLFGKPHSSVEASRRRFTEEFNKGEAQQRQTLVGWKNKPLTCGFLVKDKGCREGLVTARGYENKQLAEKESTTT